MSKKTDNTFEAQLNELTAIVESMEKGDLKLNEALAQFERGIKLSRLCQQTLEEAQQSIKILTQSPVGETLVPYQEKSDDALDQ